jgi:HK97 family phage major capsid protein
VDTDITKKIEDGLAAIETGMKDTSGRLKTLEGSVGNIKAIEDTQKKLTDEIADQRKHLNDVRRAVLNPRLRAHRPAGGVSDEAAAALGSSVILNLERGRMLERCFEQPHHYKRMLDDAQSITKSALTTSEVPLPISYYGELNELIAEYGVARRSLTPWPLSGGTDKPPRSKTGFTFTLVAISGLFAEKAPAIEFCTLSSHKYGGIILVPRELREQSIVNLGQYFAKMASTRFALIEDTVAFLADATATYESRSGICKVLDVDGTYEVNTDAGKTSPSDIEVKHLRSMINKVNPGARAKGRWYMNQTWEPYLPEFNTAANQYTFRYGPNNQAFLLGYPITWVEVMQAYTEDAAISTYPLLFGDLSWWLFGTRPGPRIDESLERYFEYDQIATRFIEEMDVDYLALAAASVLKLPAA